METSFIKKGHRYYLNAPFAFDIETSSFYNEKGDKQALMYCWCFGVGNVVLMGRSWRDWLNLLDFIKNLFKLDETHSMIIYIHNLSYEFGFIQKLFEWENVFALAPRKVCYARAIGVEFRCSYILTNYSLSTLAKNLNKHKIKKLVGYLDYSKVRTPLTKLTNNEMEYIYSDVIILLCFLKEQIDKDGDVAHILITNTSYIRMVCRNACFYDESAKNVRTRKYYNYKRFINTLTLSSEEYLLVKRAFQGGFTHANPFFVEKTAYNVASFDETSAYPSVMCAERFPMSKGKRVVIDSKQSFDFFIKNKCCIFEIKFIKLESTVQFDNYLSFSKCTGKNIKKTNGRVISGDEIVTTITNIDFEIIQAMYRWEKMEIGICYVYNKAYLPLDIINVILDLYSKKTTLKGVVGKEVEYTVSKGQLNSIYGMSVTDPLQDDISFTNYEWVIEKKTINIDEKIKQYNYNQNRFQFYLWGVFTTAYARKNLFQAIFACQNDYIYSDTDSVKIRNYKKYLPFFEKYNENIGKKLQKMCDYYDIDFNLTHPKTIKGVEKPLGVWDYEGTYKAFKTLGAKRYILIDEQNNLSITIAGVNKHVAIPYILEKWGKYGFFKQFTDGLFIPSECTGKMTHTYIDDEMEGIVSDYKGQPYHYKERTGVHLEASHYSLKISENLVDYIKTLFLCKKTIDK